MENCDDFTVRYDQLSQRIVLLLRAIINDDDVYSTSTVERIYASASCVFLATCEFFVLVKRGVNEDDERRFFTTIYANLVRHLLTQHLAQPPKHADQQRNKDIVKYAEIACRQIARLAWQYITESDCGEPSSSFPVSRDTPYTCPVCSFTFAKSFHYIQHIRVHYRLNMYECYTCGRSFVQLNGLNYHEMVCCDEEATSHAVSTKTFELCDSCDVFFQNGSELRNHVLYSHARTNIDLGINRVQQAEIRRWLRLTDTRKSCKGR